MSSSALIRLDVRGLIHGVANAGFGISLLATGAAVNSTDLFNWLEGCETPTRTFLTGQVGAMNTSAWTVGKLNAYYYPAGALKATVSAGLILDPAVAGHGASIGNAQDAVVVTTYSGHAGRTGRGRFFVPMTAALPHTDVSLITSADTQALADAAGAWIGALASNSAGGIDVVPAVATPRSSGPGFPIISVSVDNRTDSQRTRADKIAATVFSTADI